MNKSGIVVTVGIVLLCMGMKFNSVAMNRVSGNDVMTSSGLSAVDRALLNDQIKQLDAQIAQKEQELEKAGRFEEYAVKKELNALRKQRDDAASMFTLDVVLAQSELRQAIPAKQCSLSKEIIQFLYFKTAKTLQHGTGVKLVAWSPDGNKLASGSGKAVKIWNAAMGGTQVGLKLQHDSGISSLAFSPDGSKLATGRWNARIWNTTTGAQIGQNLQHGGEVNSLAWSSDGNKLATASSEAVKIWNVVTGAQIGHNLESAITPVAWSPDGKNLATGWRYHHKVKIWRTIATSFLPSSGFLDSDAHLMVWSSDGKKLATASQFTVKIWDASNETQIGRDLFPKFGVNSVAWNPDGRKLAIGYDHMISIWDVSIGFYVYPNLQDDNEINSVAWSPNGSMLATASGKTVKIFDLYMISEFLASLNIDQCELLQAFDLAIQEKKYIQATQEQRYTFSTFPKAIRDSLRSYIETPATQAAPMLEESERKRMDERVGKALEEMWEREEREAQRK